MPSEDTDKTVRTGLAVLSVLIVAYSLVIVQQILLGLLAVAALWLVYLFWRFVGVLGRIAAALERLARDRERSTAGPDEGAAGNVQGEPVERERMD